MLKTAWLRRGNIWLRHFSLVASCKAHTSHCVPRFLMLQSETRRDWTKCNFLTSTLLPSVLLLSNMARLYCKLERHTVMRNQFRGFLIHFGKTPTQASIRCILYNKLEEWVTHRSQHSDISKYPLVKKNPHSLISLFSWKQWFCSGKCCAASPCRTRHLPSAFWVLASYLL